MKDVEFEGLKPYFDDMPIAFSVVELILGENGEPVDFVFRYANHALAELDEVKMENLVGKYFYKEVFEENHDRKWLEYYHAAAFLNQTLELHEFSPEIGKYLKIICYPWRREGCCACVLFDETALIRAEKRLEYLAHYDKTTQFGNQNAYLEFLRRFQAGTDAGVIFVDVNDLKTINDRYGHDAGNFLIRMVRDHIQDDFQDMRESIFRIGGDEFVIVCLHADRESVRRQAEMLRRHMSNSNILHLPPILASVGWSWAAQADSLEELVRQADFSMYEEKRNYHWSGSVAAGR